MIAKNARACSACIAIVLLGCRGRDLATSSVTDLASGDLAERQAAAETIRLDRKRLVEELVGLAGREVEPQKISTGIGVIRLNPRNDAKHLSIRLLGDMRAVEAVPVLIDNLVYHNPRSDVTDAIGGIEFWYPAAESLAKIGSPAVEAVVRELARHSENRQERRNCVWILRSILGKELTHVKLSRAIEETSDRMEKDNLRAAVPLVEHDALRIEGSRWEEVKED